MFSPGVSSLSKKYMPANEAWDTANKYLKDIRNDVEYAEIVGSLPRWQGTEREHKQVGDIDLLVVPKSDVELDPKPPFEIFKTNPQAFEPSVVHWLAGKAIIGWKQKAKDQGFKLNRYGLQTPEGNVTDAEEIARRLDIEYPKHIREALQRWKLYQGKGVRPHMDEYDDSTWVSRVSNTSEALSIPPGTFKLPSTDLAKILYTVSNLSRRRKGSARQSAVSMLNYYINRAGSNLSDIDRKRLQDAKIHLATLFNEEKTAAYAPGIKSKFNFGDHQQLTPGEIYDLFIQRHFTDKSKGRDHLDLRIGNPDLNLFSWAIPKAKLPTEGGKNLAVQTQIHSHDYGSWGGTIPAGYGAGKVVSELAGKVLVTKVGPNHIDFTIADAKTPTRYKLVKIVDKKAGKKNWLIIHRPIADDPEIGVKPKFEMVSDADLPKVLERAVEVQEKIDGVHGVYKVDDKGHLDVFSSKRRNTGEPIVYTERLGLSNTKLPKEYADSVFRSEIYGMTPQQGSIPFGDIGGFLNSNLDKAIQTQKELNLQLKNAPFDVARLGGQDVKSLAYPERKKILERLIQSLPEDKFELPLSASEPQDIHQLIGDIKGGKNPKTHEGVIIRHDHKGYKYKIRPDSTVHFRGTFPGEGRRGATAGGFLFSDKPDGDPLGRVGTGFTDEELAKVIANMDNYMNKPFVISHQGRGDTGLYRMPSFLGWEEGLNGQEPTRVKATASLEKLANIDIKFDSGMQDFIKQKYTNTSPGNMAKGFLNKIPGVERLVPDSSVKPTIDFGRLGTDASTYAAYSKDPNLSKGLSPQQLQLGQMADGLYQGVANDPTKIQAMQGDPKSLTSEYQNSLKGVIGGIPGASMFQDEIDKGIPEMATAAQKHLSSSKDPAVNKYYQGLQNTGRNTMMGHYGQQFSGWLSSILDKIPMLGDLGRYLLKPLFKFMSGLNGGDGLGKFFSNIDLSKKRLDGGPAAAQARSQDLATAHHGAPATPGGTEPLEKAGHLLSFVDIMQRNIIKA